MNTLCVELSCFSCMLSCVSVEFIMLNVNYTTNELLLCLLMLVTAQ